MNKIIIFLLIIFSALSHELGHYFAMKQCNVEVEEISIGVGPKIYQKQLKYTKFSIRLFLIGAYVLPKNFFNIVKSNLTPLRKLYIFSIGILINLIFGIVFRILCYYFIYTSFQVGIYMYWMSFINFYMVVINLLPVLGITDGAKIIKILSDKYLINKIVKNFFTISFNICGTILFIYWCL